MVHRILVGAGVSMFAGSAAVAAVSYESEAAFLAAAPYATTVNDFDAIAAGTTITNLPGITSVSGVDLNGAAASVNVGSVAGLPFPMTTGTHSGDHFLSTSLDSPVFATGRITLNFTTPKNAVGFWVSDTAPLGNFVIDLYSGGALVDSLTSTIARTFPDSFYGAVSDKSFDTAVVYGANRFDSWGIDDLRFGAVPAPSTAVVGLLSLAGIGRRRR